MRAFWFFGVSVLAATLTFAASGGQPRPEPSESQMKSSFSQFFSKLETGAMAEIRFASFKKHACKPSSAASGHYCSFTYSAGLPAEQLSVFPTDATISGMFLSEEDGQIRFEMVMG